MGFAWEGDARRVLEVFPKRFGKYGWTLPPDKTRRVPFRRPTNRPARSLGVTADQPGVFDLRGFRHDGGRSRSGTWVVKRKTAPDRFRRAVRTIARWCRRFGHQPLTDQHRTRWQKLRGPFTDDGIPCTGKALQRFR